MHLLRSITQLWRADPALEWIRERDVDAARRRLLAAAAVSIIATPVLVIPARTDALGTSNAMLGSGTLIMCLLLSATLFALGLNIGRPALVKRPLLELIAWFIVAVSLSSIGSFLAIHKSGVMMLSGISGMSAEDLMSQLVKYPEKATMVVWIGSFFTAMGLIISTRGLVVPPLGYLFFVLLVMIGFVADDPNVLQNRNAVAAATLFGALAMSINLDRYRVGMHAYDALLETESAKHQQEVFLSSVLPSSMLEKVQRNERVADSFSNLTVIFADMVGFTALSRRVSPGHLVDVLNEIFAAGDEIAAECGIEKVKTIGDCYMAVAGGIASSQRGSADAIEFAQRYLHKVEEVSKRLDIPLALRVGIHTGPAVGGIIGTSRPAYDYWGDTVNLASRLESASGAGRILVSESTWLQTKRKFDFEEGEDIDVKGVGTVRSHFLAGPAQDGKIIPLVQRTN